MYFKFLTLVTIFVSYASLGTSIPAIAKLENGLSLRDTRDRSALKENINTRQLINKAYILDEKLPLKSIGTRVINNFDLDDNCTFCTVAHLLGLANVETLIDLTGIMQEKLDYNGVIQLLQATGKPYSAQQGNSLPTSKGLNNQYGVLYTRADGSAHCVVGYNNGANWLFFDYQDGSGRKEVSSDVLASTIYGTFWFT